jgi:hypothetical protein
MTTFNETAMAERFKSATEPTDHDLAKILLQTYAVIMKDTDNDHYEFEHLYGLRVMLRHIAGWLGGRYDDQTILELIRVNTKGTFKRLEKL